MSKSIKNPPPGMPPPSTTRADTPKALATRSAEVRGAEKKLPVDQQEASRAKTGAHASLEDLVKQGMQRMASLLTAERKNARAATQSLALRTAKKKGKDQARADFVNMKSREMAKEFGIAREDMAQLLDNLITVFEAGEKD